MDPIGLIIAVVVLLITTIVGVVGSLINKPKNGGRALPIFEIKYPFREHVDIDYSGLDISKNLTMNYYYYYLVKLNTDQPLTMKDILILDNESLGDYEKINLDSVIHHSGGVILNLWVAADLDKLRIRFSKPVRVRKVFISEQIVKQHDSYMLTWADNPIQELDELFQAQAQDFKSIPNSTSPPIFNQITAEKIDYTKYLVDQDLIPADTTQIMTKGEVGDVRKYPYSSMHKCVFINKPAPAKCRDLGIYISQKYNSKIAFREFKCHVINGRVLTSIKYDKYRKGKKKSW